MRPVRGSGGVAVHGGRVVCAGIDIDAAKQTADAIVNDFRGTAYVVRVGVANGDQMEAFA
ncbi:hypothetical protein [Nonomuraea sp. NPDC049309]|uniref:hypothetical protein n=1 Tax=Nonomuraea sp. NPDC049309 TaxID=3364350 RepID=UPI0037232AD5